MITQTERIATARLIGEIAQVGTSNPTITPIINTIGTITILRVIAGQYHIQSPTQQFITDKTRINGVKDGATPIMLAIAALNDNFIQFVVNSESVIQMDVKNAAGTRVELSSLQGGTLTIPINIEVYNTIQEI